jgi:hypothetical protein
VSPKSLGTVRRTATYSDRQRVTVCKHNGWRAVALWSSDPDLSLKNTLCVENDGNKYKLFVICKEHSNLNPWPISIPDRPKAEQEEKASWVIRCRCTAGNSHWQLQVRAGYTCYTSTHYYYTSVHRLSYSGLFLVLFWSYCSVKTHLNVLQMTNCHILVFIWSCSGPIAPWRPTWNVTHMSDCPILNQFWSCLGPIAPWRPTWNVMQMSDCPFLSLFWSCLGPIAPWRPTWMCCIWLIVLFWAYSGLVWVLLLHDGPV